MGIIDGFLTYLYYVYMAISYALRLDPRLYEVVSSYPNTSIVVLGVVFLSGASMLLGQSVVLFANRVRKGRFFFSLALNGFMFIVSYFVWGVTISLIGHLLFPVEPAAWAIVRMVGLSTAPLIFGFFILIPWMGPFIGKILNIWGFLILLTVVEFGFQVGLVRALVCVGLGWLLMLGINNLIGKPIIALRNKVWQRVAGSSLDASTQDLLLNLSKNDEDVPLLLRGGQK